MTKIKAAIFLAILAFTSSARAGTPVSPDQKERLCAEKIKALTTVQTNLDETRYSIGYFQSELEEKQKELDEHRKYATAAQFGNWNEIPAAWFELSHLRVDYSGPPPKVAVPGTDVTLTYWLDVTANGGKLTGQTYTHSKASYEGKTTEMWFQMTLDLHKS